VGCTVEPPDIPGDPGMVKIQEHRGQDLSSVNDFRGNSIRGPQYVDPAQYTLRVHGLVDNKQV